MKAYYRGFVSREEEMPFRILKDINLPEIITPTEEDTGEFSLFKKGATIIGVPAELEFLIKDSRGNLKTIPKARFIIKETVKGIYAIPFENIDPNWTDDQWDNMAENPSPESKEKMKETIVSTIEKAKDVVTSKDPKELFGFNYKQLAVIALVGVITSKILK